MMTTLSGERALCFKCSTARSNGTRFITQNYMVTECLPQYTDGVFTIYKRCSGVSHFMVKWQMYWAQIICQIGIMNKEEEPYVYCLPVASKLTPCGG